MPPAHFQPSNTQVIVETHRRPVFLRVGLVCLALTGGLLILAGNTPGAAYQAIATETATVTPTAFPVTPTPQPTRLHPTATPAPIPPREQIGSTDGIIGLGVVIVAIILGTLLWHRQDWARKRSTRENQSGRT